MTALDPFHPTEHWKAGVTHHYDVLRCCIEEQDL